MTQHHAAPPGVARHHDECEDEVEMATDVNIPGDELARAQDTLTFVHDFIDLEGDAFDFEAALGPALANGSAGEFDQAWEDGRFQLRRQITGVRDAIGKVLDQFEKIDDEAAASLDQEG